MVLLCLVVSKSTMAIQSYSYSGRGSERTAYRIIFFGQSNRIGFHYILSHFFLTLWFYKTPHMTSKVTPLSQQSKIPNPTQPNPTALSRHSSPARPPPESPSPDRRRVRVPTGGFSPCITMGSDFKAIPLIGKIQIQILESCVGFFFFFYLLCHHQLQLVQLTTDYDCLSAKDTRYSFCRILCKDTWWDEMIYACTLKSPFEEFLYLCSFVRH